MTYAIIFFQYDDEEMRAKYQPYYLVRGTAVGRDLLNREAIWRADSLSNSDTDASLFLLEDARERVAELNTENGGRPYVNFAVPGLAETPMVYGKWMTQPLIPAMPEENNVSPSNN